MSNIVDELLNKYPNLFHINSEGKAYTPCFSDCPPGWADILHTLCAAIQTHNNSYRSKQIPVNKIRFYAFKYSAAFLTWVHYNILIKFINKPSINKILDKIKSKLRLKSNKHGKIISVHPPALKIDQIKEKFGTLCVYTTGGDQYVQGMIQYAEYLSSVTCEVTGKPGMPHVRGYWVKTLNVDLPKENVAYSGYVPLVSRKTQSNE